MSKTCSLYKSINTRLQEFITFLANDPLIKTEILIKKLTKKYNHKFYKGNVIPERIKVTSRLFGFEQYIICCDEFNNIYLTDPEYSIHFRGWNILNECSEVQSWISNSEQTVSNYIKFVPKQSTVANNEQTNVVESLLPVNENGEPQIGTFADYYDNSIICCGSSSEAVEIAMDINNTVPCTAVAVTARTTEHEVSTIKTKIRSGHIKFVTISFRIYASEKWSLYKMFEQLFFVNPTSCVTKENIVSHFTKGRSTDIVVPHQKDIYTIQSMLQKLKLKQ